MDVIGEYLIQSKEGQETQTYGYSLHIEIVGKEDGIKKRHVLYHTHPASDGSVKGWEKIKSLYEERKNSNGNCDRNHRKGIS